MITVMLFDHSLQHLFLRSPGCARLARQIAFWTSAVGNCGLWTFNPTVGAEGPTEPGDYFDNKKSDWNNHYDTNDNDNNSKNDGNNESK